MKNILLIFFLFLTIFCSGQTPEVKTILSSSQGLSGSNYEVLFREKFDFNLASTFTALPKTSGATFAFPNPCMSGLFCKIEYKFETLSQLAPRFRLGSLNYTNWMEGKGELYSRYQ